MTLTRTEEVIPARRQQAEPCKGVNMVSVADIKKDLPDWPDDIIEQWLHYFANEDGLFLGLGALWQPRPSDSAIRSARPIATAMG